MSERITIRVPNQPNYLERVHTLASAVLDPLPLSSRAEHRLLVAISEGSTNAYLHGNQRKPECFITLHFEIHPGFVLISIQDEGILPIDDNVDHLITAVDVGDESGRGLRLIGQLSDEIKIRHEPEAGNILTMKAYFDRRLGHGNTEGHSKTGNQEVISEHHS